VQEVWLVESHAVDCNFVIGAFVKYEQAEICFRESAAKPRLSDTIALVAWCGKSNRTVEESPPMEDHEEWERLFLNDPS
jgi:hypothetical protein